MKKAYTKINQSIEELSNYSYRTKGNKITLFQIHPAYGSVDGWSEDCLNDLGFQLVSAEIANRKTQQGSVHKIWISKTLNIYINLSIELRLNVGKHVPARASHTLADIFNALMSNKKSRRFFDQTGDDARKGKKEMLGFKALDMISDAGDSYTWRRVNTRSVRHDHAEQKVVLTHVNGQLIKDVFKGKTPSKLAKKVREAVAAITLSNRCEIQGDTSRVSTTPVCIM